MDNCWRENKNKYALAYLSYLIQCNVFDQIELSFLPVGHTHIDIDQLFSTFPKYLLGENAITINQLHHILNKKHTIMHIEHVEYVPDIASHMIDNKWIEDIYGIIFIYNNNNNNKRSI